MKRALIVSAGEYSPIDLNLKFDHIYACDKGYLYAQEMGLECDTIIGDFDSFRETSYKDSFPPISDEIPFDEDIIRTALDLSGRVRILSHKVAKDDTDTMLAIKAALDDGANEIYIICALGGRIDHTFANIQSLNYIASHNAIGHIYSKDEHLSILKGPFSETISRKEGYSLSLYSISDISKGLTIKGTLYEVDNIDLTNSFPLAYGNKITENKARISLSEGNLLIIESKIGGGN